MYVSNVPISKPNSVPDAKTDVNMNGFSWSNKYGLFFDVSDVVITSIKPPSPKA